LAGKNSGIWLALLSLTVFSSTNVARATGSYTLTSSNSSVTIDAGSDWGMSNWTVDCVDQLYRQWFWYCVGDSGKERPVNSLSFLGADCGGTGGLSLLYGSSQFRVDLSFSLTGGAWGTHDSDIDEKIKIRNISSSPLQFHLFQYADFDLAGSGPGDSLTLGKNSAGLFNSAN